MKKKLSDEAKIIIQTAIVVGEMVTVFGVGIFIGKRITEIRCQAKINEEIATRLINGTAKVIEPGTVNFDI